MKQIFTNADKIHAAKVLHRLGLEDCFEGIICFETLNDMNCSNENADCDSEYPNDIFDILAMEPNSDLPVTPVMCKPSKDAFEQAIKIANVDPHRTVSTPFDHLFSIKLEKVLVLFWVMQQSVYARIER